MSNRFRRTLRRLCAVALSGLAAAGAAQAAEPPAPAAVFEAYEQAVMTADAGAVEALVAPDAKRPPFFQCPPGQTDRQCLITYLVGTVVTQHTRFTNLGVETSGNTVTAKLEVRNDLTRRAGVDRFTGSDRVKVKNGKIVEFAFLRDEQDPQTVTFFQSLARGPAR